MSTMNFSMKLIGSNSSIANDMLRALLPELNGYFSQINKTIKTEIPPIIIDAIKNQPEYASLIGGQLMGEFGLPDAASRLSSILSTIESGAIVTFNPLTISSGSIRGSVKLQMIQKDFNDLLSLGESTFTTEKGTQLEWLRWLLIEGDTVIISDYSFVAGANPNSRTGMGIMKNSNSSFWRVPPEFAGNVNNNWITRALQSVESSIEQTLERILSRT